MPNKFDEYRDLLNKHIKHVKPIEVENIKIKCLPDLYKLVSQLKPIATNNKTNTVILNNIETVDGIYKEFPVNFKDDGQPMVRKVLIDGFNLLKRQQKFSTLSGIYRDELEGFGGFFPALSENDSGVSWIAEFVSKHLDGTIDGLYVVWSLPEGKFRLDPWLGTIEKIDVSNSS